MPDIHLIRRAALRSLLAANGLDALLVSHLSNVRYLTGFTGSNASVLLHAEDEDRTLFCTDGRYVTQAGGEVPDLTLVVDRASVHALVHEINRSPQTFRRTGFESQHVSVEAHQDLTAMVHGWELVRAPGLIEQLRLIKDQTEVRALRQACGIADAALAHLLERGAIRRGRTELEIARELENTMLELGSSERSFGSIVGTGANSAIPHHQSDNSIVRAGDFLVLDFGATVDGYHSDMTRTFVIEKPTNWHRDLYEIVSQAQRRAVDSVRAGVDLVAVDTSARYLINSAGYGEMFTHGLGHNVGLDIHEPPILSQRSDGKLADGMAITIEPGIYLPGQGGVRIEDTLIVRDGPPEILTLSSKEFTVVG